MSISCTSDSDCDFNTYCQQSSSTCQHDGLWPPNAVDIITYLIIPWVIAIGNVGGLGGGIIKVPLLMLVLGYQSKQATFISYCILFGSCLSNSSILIFKRHPIKDRTLINYTIVLVLNPMVLLGTNIGIYLNILLPEVVAGILLILFLCSICPYLYKKGMNLYHIKKNQDEIPNNCLEDNSKEYLQSLMKGKESTSLDSNNINYSNSLDSNKERYSIDANKLRNENKSSQISSDSIVNDKSVKGSLIKNDPNEELQAFLNKEKKQVPYEKIIILTAIFCSVQFLVFLKGGKGLSSFVGITTCSTMYWIVLFLIVLDVSICFCIIRLVTTKWEKERRYVIDKYSLQSDYSDEIDLRTFPRYCLIAFSGLLTGVLSGTFGVGAGLALVPILLSFNMNPLEASATSGFNYFFISLTTLIQIFTNNFLNMSQIGLFAFLAFFGGLVCARLIYYYVYKYKAAYAVTFIVLGLAILNIVSFIVYLTKKGVQHGWSSIYNVTPFCNQ